MLKYLLFLLYAGTLFAQNTVGLIHSDSTKTFQGYTLFSPSTTRTTYLIDTKGQVVHQWESKYTPGQSVMLLADGTLLHTGVIPSQLMQFGGAGGVVEKVAWDGTVLWHYEHISANARQHHDAEIMPNGNILIPVWESHSIAEAIANGRDASRLTESTLWMERIIEVRQTGPNRGEVVWEWSVMDHLIQDYDSTKLNYGVVADHPERININVGPTIADWLHINSVRYNASRDEVMVSVHNLGEIWVISRKTGDVVYRYGNPANYNAGTAADQVFFGAHDARWTAEDGSKIMVFNNGLGGPEKKSKVEELHVPLNADGTYKRTSGAFGPTSPTLLYPPVPTTAFYAMNISGATRLPNDNILSCLGPSGTFIESTPAGEEVWRYVNPANLLGIAGQGDTAKNNAVFKIYRYAPDFPGFDGKQLIPNGTVEDGPTSVAETSTPSAITVSLDILAQRATITVTTPGNYHIDAFDILGRYLGSIVNEELAPGTYQRTVPHTTYVTRHN